MTYCSYVTPANQYYERKSNISGVSSIEVNDTFAL